MGDIQGTALGPGTVGAKSQLLERYDKRIAYYWKASRHNRNAYKVTRSFMTIMGALLTLVSSLASANFVKGGLGLAFAVSTPLLAAGMAIVAGVSQAFQWGAAWSDSVVTAMRLERERGRIAVTLPEELDPVKEMALLDDAVLAETQVFFQRIFGSGGTLKPDTKQAG